jgi:hypothetical protein
MKKDLDEKRCVKYIFLHIDKRAPVVEGEAKGGAVVKQWYTLTTLII